MKPPNVRALLAAVALSGLANGGCIYSRIIFHNIPRLSDAHYFDQRVVHASPSPEPLPSAAHEAEFLLTPTERRKYASFDEMLEASDTRAFVAVRDGRIVYERYFGGFDANTLVADFSISKTFAALLVGCAVADHVLGPVDRTLVSYVPELARHPGYSAITIDELLRMTSGIDYVEESYGGAELYYSRHLPQHVYKYGIKWKPGSHYEYGSITTQILQDVLHRNLPPGQTVSQYFEQRIWQPLGSTHDATWSLDSDWSGVEKFAAGFNATARDHARLGLLFLNDGRVGEKQVVPRDWVADSLEHDPVPGLVHTTDGWVQRGKYQWFLTEDGSAYFAKGYDGQYVFVIPSARMVFVRFGKGYGDVDWVALFMRLASVPR